VVVAVFHQAPFGDPERKEQHDQRTTKHDQRCTTNDPRTTMHEQRSPNNEARPTMHEQRCTGTPLRGRIPPLRHRLCALPHTIFLLSWPLAPKYGIDLPASISAASPLPCLFAFTDTLRSHDRSLYPHLVRTPSLKRFGADASSTKRRRCRATRLPPAPAHIRTDPPARAPGSGGVGTDTDRGLGLSNDDHWRYCCARGTQQPITLYCQLRIGHSVPKRNEQF
jgi:hypothetical protein